jgi:hypothetical protein
MKIALIEKYQENDTTPRYKASIYSKEDISYIAKLVPNFAARWQLFRKYFPTPKSTIKRNRTLTTTATYNTRFILKKRPQHTNKTKSKVIKNAAPP